MTERITSTIAVVIVPREIKLWELIDTTKQKKYWRVRHVHLKTTRISGNSITVHTKRTINWFHIIVIVMYPRHLFDLQ